MDFLAFLKSGSTPGSECSGNEIEFDGMYFKRRNDVFPEFEVYNNKICEYHGSVTDYFLSPVNTWGGHLEYSIWRGSSTGYNIRISGSTVTLYYAGTRVYED